MVTQDSPPHSSSSMLHQFIQSPSQLENQNLNTFPQSSLGLMPPIHSFGDRISSRFSTSQESEMSHTRHFMDLLGAAANESSSNHHQQVQRLSLSLGSQMGFPPPHEVQFRQSGSSYQNDYSFNNNASFAPSSSSYATESFFLAMKNSRYLGPAQSLLGEIASVGGRSVEINNEKYVVNLIQSRRRGGLASELRAELCSSMNSNLITPEKQELHITISKLVALLDEVDMRYEKYYQQLEDAVSSFEEMAGLGAGKSYTALALQAMSRHFCSLRDGIVSQINGARRKLLQQENSAHHVVSNGISQLSLFDEEGRHHQEAAGRLSLQQLGLLQCQRQQWRPIRGLPETSVAILRSWLFEHFLNPYPNDSEKLMLASQTGLTKNQVANWFINARVRLWKPMIEEMYKEEFAESSEDSNPLREGGENNGFGTRREGFATDDHSDD